MKLSSISIRRGITFTMIYVAAVGFGLFSLARLRLDLYPDITFPVVLVMSQYTGAGPFDIETVLTEPMEQTVASVEGLQRITSTSRAGLSLIVMEFDWGHDMDKAQTDVIRALEWVSDYLPDDATDPMVFAFDPSQMPIMFTGIGSPVLDQAELRRVATEHISPRIERIPGVATADVVGGLERQIRVQADPRALASYGLAISDVTHALRGGNLQVPGGMIKDGRTAFSVRTLGEFQSIDEIRSAIVTARGGQTIRVSDVAAVIDGYKELDGVARINQQPGLMCIVRKQSDANTVQVARAVEAALPDIARSVPGDVEIVTIFNQADFIDSAVGNLGSSGLTAFILTAVVLLVFLRNVRSMLIIATAIPASVIVTFFVLDMYGTTLNIISMAGLALAIGMLVDNSIVVLENIYRFREQGVPRHDAADRGTGQVAMAITASTLTTLAVFVPMLFVPGIAGVMFRDMVLAVCFALATSLFVAVTLIPLLSSRFLSRPGRPRFFVFAWISAAIGSALDGIASTHARWLDRALAHRLWTVIIAATLFIGSFVLLGRVGFDFLPRTDQGEFQVSIERAVGTDLPSTLESFMQVERIVREEVPEARILYTNIGAGGGLGAIFGGQDTHSGNLRVKLTARTERARDQFQIQDALRQRLDEIPGITYTFGQGQGMRAGADIELRLFIDDLDAGRELANQLVRRIREVPGAVDVRSGLREGAPELRIQLDRPRLQAMGLTAGQVTNTVSQAIQGQTATRYRERGDEYDVFVRLADEYRQSPTHLDQIMVALPSGGSVPLRQVADVWRDVAPVAITRENQARMVMISAGVSGRDLGSVENDVMAIIEAMDLPADVIVEMGGAAEDRQESFYYLSLAILAGVALVYMVMASQFESFLAPLIILFTVPLSFVGAALALLITGTSLSLMAMIGLLVLVGIVVNNGIVLVDYTIQVHERENLDYLEAAREGGRVRMRPVLMTALTTAFGMLPLALGTGEGGETWAPLARVVMGGLLVAAAMTLIVVPVTYTIVMQLADRLRRWLSLGGHAPEFAGASPDVHPAE